MGGTEQTHLVAKKNRVIPNSISKATSLMKTFLIHAIASIDLVTRTSPDRATQTRWMFYNAFKQQEIAKFGQ